MSVKLVRLTQFAAAARAEGYAIPTTLTYRSLRDRATEARFPAEMVGQVWHFDRENTEVIANALGLVKIDQRQQRAAA